MTDAIRGPQAPFVGAVYEARARGGRKWEVWAREPPLPKAPGVDRWLLVKLGAGGQQQTLMRTTGQLRDRKRWRMVGVTPRAAE